jgi:multiple sugar transport system permease protein
MRVVGYRRVRRLKRITTYTLLGIWSVIVLFPMYWLLITSFKLPVDVIKGLSYIPWWDFKPSLYAWEYLFSPVQSQETWAPFMNSAVIAVLAAACALFIGALGGYGLARFSYQFKGLRNNHIAFWFISQRMMPPVIVVFPIMIMFRSLRLMDTRTGMILVYATFGVPFVVWVMRDFFAAIPKEIEESAYIDGCSRLQAFVRIALPLSAPGLVACFLLVLIFSINEYLFALLLTFKAAATMPIYIAGQTLSAKGLEWWTMSALTLFAVVPTIVLGLLLEKYVARGIVLGSLKG